MKKIVLIAFFILITLLPVAALDHRQSSQRIFGYIDDIMYLSVSTYRYADTAMGNYVGINLDSEDENNGFRYLISPAHESPGLQIGSFSMLTTFAVQQRAARLTVSHTKLVLDSNPSVSVDYELGILYSISDGSKITSPDPAFCLSTGSIVLNISSTISTVMDGSIYFRLATGNENKVSQAGQYSSTVTFNLEVL